MSTLNKWVAQHKDDDLISGPHDDLHKKLARLRKENRGVSRWATGKRLKT